MKILLSWLKKFIKFNFNKKKIYKIFNTLGIEILNIEKIYPINYYKINNKNICFFKSKIKHIYKYKICYKFLTYENILIKNKYFLKKNTLLLINNKKKILFTNYDKDYIIEINLTPNINYLSYYINITNSIISYLNFKKKKFFCNKFINFNNYKKIYFKKKKSIKFILNNKKDIKYLKCFFISNINNHFDFNIINQNTLSKISSITYNLNDYINNLIKESGIPIILLDFEKIKDKVFIIDSLKKTYNFFINNNKYITLKKKDKDILLFNNNIAINLNGVINNNYYNVTNKSKKALLLIYILNNKKILKFLSIYKIKNLLSNIYKNKVNLNNVKYVLNNLKEKFNNKISLIYNYNKIKIKNKSIILYYNFINKYIGVKIKPEIILKILKSLNYNFFKNKNYIKIKINNFYYINNKIDIINEIIKYLDINKIKNNNIILNLNNNIKGPKSNIYKIINNISNILINYGMYEVINTPFLNKKYNNLYKKDDIIINNKLKLRNKLFYKIKKNIVYNINRNNKNIKFFEIGNTYKKVKSKFKEEKRIEILIFKNKINNILKYYYKIYNILKIILEKLGIKNYKKKIINYKKILILKNKKLIIKFNLIFKNYFIFYIVIYIENIFNILKNKTKIKYKKYSKYQNIEKDLTFIIDKNIYYDDFLKITKKKLKKNLIQLNLFDIYTKNLPRNKKSYTFRFILKNKFGINKKYINKLLNNLIKIYNKKLGAILKYKI